MVTGSAVPSPQPFGTLSGSDTGSVSSAAQMANRQQSPANFLPPGIAMGPNGEFYDMSTGMQVEVNPNFAAQMAQTQAGGVRHNHRQPLPLNAGGRAFVPQFSNHQSHPSQHSSQSSFPSPYFDGRSSPFSPNGFFAPPRAAKISIRAPTGQTKAAQADGEAPASMSSQRSAYATLSDQSRQEQYLAQAYNPYANGGAGMDFNPQMQMNGMSNMGMNGMRSMDGIDGMSSMASMSNLSNVGSMGGMGQMNGYSNGGMDGMREGQAMYYANQPSMGQGGQYWQGQGNGQYGGGQGGQGVPGGGEYDYTEYGY